MRGQEHTTSPRPAPMMAEVGVSISGMPGPPCGPSYRMMMTCTARPPQNTQIRLGRTNGSWSPFLSRPTLVSRRPAMHTFCGVRHSPTRTVVRAPVVPPVVRPVVRPVVDLAHLTGLDLSRLQPP